MFVGVDLLEQEILLQNTVYDEIISVYRSYGHIYIIIGSFVFAVVSKGLRPYGACASIIYCSGREFQIHTGSFNVNADAY